MKNFKLWFFGISLLSYSLHAEAQHQLKGACLASVVKKLPSCKSSQILKEYSVESRNFVAVYMDCTRPDDSAALYALVERIAGDDCKLMDSDVSLIGYMYGVSAKYKSNAPIKAFEHAIKAQLSHQIKNDDAKKLYIEKLKQKSLMKDITVDQQWVLKYLSQGSEP